MWLNCAVKQARNYLFHKRFFALLNLEFQYWISPPQKRVSLQVRALPDFDGRQ
ncbi:TPA: DUF1367 family protein [Enterobacter ludwigii]|nr:DUF1367 family protein [Enterobacter ludwigii]